MAEATETGKATASEEAEGAPKAKEGAEGGGEANGATREGTLRARPMPRPKPWERCFEVFATAATGVIFILKLLDPVWIFITSCALVWIGWCGFQFCRYGSGILFLWGIRVDQPNLRKSFLLPSLFAVFALVFICVGAAVEGREIRFDNWHLWLIFFLYPFYGVLQHVMLQSFLMRNLSWCITGMDEYSVLHAFLKEPRILGFLGVLACVAASVSAFAFVHWPDPWLIAGTGVMGVPWAIEYLLHRNVLPLGLYHGFLGTLFYFWSAFGLASSGRLNRFDEACLTPNVERIFIDGDCVPPSFFPYIRALRNQSELAVFAAIKGSSATARVEAPASREHRLRSELVNCGIEESRLLLLPTATGAENAADVLLTYLFGRYAGTKNYLVSDDRKWFQEVVRAEPWRCTIWITSDRLLAIEEAKSPFWLSETVKRQPAKAEAEIARLSETTKAAAAEVSRLRAQAADKEFEASQLEKQIRRLERRIAAFDSPGTSIARGFLNTKGKAAGEPQAPSAAAARPAPERLRPRAGTIIDAATGLELNPLTFWSEDKEPSNLLLRGNGPEASLMAAMRSPPETNDAFDTAKYSQLLAAGRREEAEAMIQAEGGPTLTQMQREPLALLRKHASLDPNWVDRSYHDCSLLQWACCMGYDEVASELLARGADPSHVGAKGVSCLAAACAHSSVGCAELLLEARCNADEVRVTGARSWVMLAVS
ncbi:unnamed protein product [Symbiodinium natans]|uniref:Uncharacterized protein n=1 Tax=Symbiodinium natans TaxID=878477 RepID=A0A812UCK5_9DINO|nr:unnamed protein product [Symbiodinium natans]